MGRAPYGPALRELTLARMREFLREPEAVFWVFAFPVIMTCALGIAFRTRVDEPVLVGIERAGAAPSAVASAEQALRAAGGFEVQAVDAAGVERALRDGTVQVVVQPGEVPTYRFDPARAESRLARLAVDGALQRAAGRADRFQAR
ncbi:MAG TPA: hypothetical protein VMW48_04850, partial [Vicinamibacterales bacterium]|nr:hypothetical protein [Vicinamibacterales bacterium]